MKTLMTLQPRHLQQPNLVEWETMSKVRVERLKVLG